MEETHLLTPYCSRNKAMLPGTRYTNGQYMKHMQALRMSFLVP